jgi:hypothetical protein
MGCLVAATSFDGIVHSVFARACNIVYDSCLLTVVLTELADGPTVWRLSRDASCDLRTVFRQGERLRRRHNLAATRDVVLDLSTAERWHPAPVPSVRVECLTANLRLATAALERRRCQCSSVIDRQAGAVLGSLEDACHRLDIECATADMHRLIGWGEGLTPAGDDAIVGLLAALGLLAPTDVPRLAFLRRLSEAVNASVTRTTVISGHYLRLAAQGHFNADVTRLAHALVGVAEADDGAGPHAAIRAALDVGATSGADMMTGMLAGFRAWCPANR